MAYSLQSLQAALAGHYTIEGEAGRGGMAAVFRALDLKHHRPVAIKVLHPELASAIGPDRFLHEIEIAARLQHPHILPLHDSGQADGFLYYVMPFVDGESLRQRLDREKQLPLEDALQITREVADALDYAHGQGVIHRDIKPENILSLGRHAVVADFGIARAISVAGGQNLTHTGVVLGTPTYMSPEQAMGGQAMDGRSDLYSLACVLYEMLAGEPPFTGATMESVLYQHITAQVRPVTAMRPVVPAPVTQALTRALAKAPADRFATSAQFVHALSTLPATEARVVARAPRSRRRVVALAAAALLLAVVAIGARAGWLSNLLPQGRIRSLAVLPLDNLSHDPEQEYFVDGMTEQLITELAQLGGVSVTSRTTVMRYKGTQKTVREIGRELDVDAIIEGSVMRAGTQVRITAQFIRVDQDRHLWAKSYQGDVRNVFALQNEVAQAITQQIRLKLTPRDEARLAGNRPANPEAHEAYLKGRYLARGPNVDAVRKGMEFFKEAIAKDPNYALAYAGLADAHILLGQEILSDPREAYGQAKEWAARALALDNRLGEAYASMAYASLLSWEWADAEREFQRAIELNPRYAQAHSWYASYLLAVGRLEDAVAEARRAWELDPSDLSVDLNLGMCFYYGRHFDEAIEHFRRILEANPHAVVVHYWLGLALEQQGKFEQAIAEFELVGSPSALAPLGHAYSASGREKQARDILKQFLDLAASSRGYVPAFEIATIYNGLGEKDRALEWLSKASVARTSYMIFLRAEPVFENLHSDPRFGRLLRGIGLPTSALALQSQRGEG